jgi:bacillaene synthase trans-acting acyltransferase/trans-AT polyketide synthase/acyltransferase/oxidoreductase domain-containing protein
MKKQIIFMFSGQGSQYYHMGKELYENHSRFKFWMDQCDEIVHPIVQTSLIDVLYRGQGKSEPFDQILYTNPSLLCIEYSLSRVLLAMGIQPDFLLGYSLGEITASVVSGVISLEDGIQLVVGMAKLVEEKTQLVEMLAVIEAQEIITTFPDLFQNCWLTGKNFQSSFVVSGLPNDIRHLQEGLKQKNIISQKLPVKYGFHTALLDPIEEELKQLVRNIKRLPMGIPIISSLTTATIQEVNDDHIWEVIRYPVEFERTIRSMLQKDDYIFIDVGPSGSLATFVKYLLTSNSNSLHLAAINQFGKDLNSIEKLRTSLYPFTNYLD